MNQRVALRSLSLVILLLAAGSARPARAASPRGLILYNPPPRTRSRPVNDELGAARMIGNLLGHFGITGDVLPADHYRRGLAAGCAAVFYLQIDPAVAPPSTFIQDLPHLRIPVCWLGGGLSALPPGSFGLRARGYKKPSPFDHVRYRNTLLSRGETYLYLVDAVDPRRAQVVATAVSRTGERPYAFRSGSFWYFADSAVLGAEEDDRSLAFADLLHDILGVTHAPSRQAFIRIEDVSVQSDAKQLRKIADLLGDRGVPFIVSLIPVFSDPLRHTFIPMSTRPDFVAAIRYMVARGATLVMHGWTHQYGNGVTADDAEFFDMSTRRPPPGQDRLYRLLEANPPVLEAMRRRAPVDEIRAIALKRGVPAKEANELRRTVAAIEDRLGNGLRECLAAGTPPVAWETPHYVASQLAYTTMARIFGSGVEQRLVCDHFDYGQTVPYVLERDRFGTQLFPENLGYVPGENLDHVDDIIRFAQAHTVVRDGMVGSFFHPFLDVNYLGKQVDGVRAAGYTYIDLKRLPHWVQFRDLAIRTGAGKIALRLHDELLHEYCLDQSGQRQRETWTNQRATGQVTRMVQCPPGWIYVAEGLPRRPAPPARRPRPARGKSWILNALAYLWHPVRKEPPPPPAFPRAALVWDDEAEQAASLDQRSYVNAFSALGTRLERIPPDQIAARLSRGDLNLVIAPAPTAARLERAAVEAVLALVRSGGNVITEGESALSDGLGVLFHRHPLLVAGAQQIEYPDRRIAWQRAASALHMVLPEGGLALTRDPQSSQPLVVGGEYGRGRYLALALPYDAQSELGVSRFPYLVRDAFRHFKLRPQFSSPGLHAFFDPSLRTGKDLDQLIAAWHAAGISAIHAAAWKSTRKGPYNYDRLIEHCHRRGIAVYAWLELPMADEDFYRNNPHWRELTARGDPAYQHNGDPGAWRYMMAMEDPACEAAVLDWMKRLLGRCQWDGVDLAELYFESDLEGDPGGLTPMHPVARRRFAAAAGFDPRLLVDPRSPYFWRKNVKAWKRFEDWRVEEVTRLHDATLSAIEEAARSLHRPLDVIVTVHDSLGVGTIRRDTGIDTRRIIGLLRKHDFSLQIEDPAVLWSTDPRRYVEIGERYRRLLPPAHADRLMLDLNILDLNNMKLRLEKQTVFPTARQTGTEFDLVLASAGKVVRRATLYSEDSVWPDDWNFASAAFAAGAGEAHPEGARWRASLQRGALFNLDLNDEQLSLDGKDWPVLGDDRILLPPGEHQISMSAGKWLSWAPPLRLTDATVELLSADAIPGGLRVSYWALGPGSIELDGEPYAVVMEDGRRLHAQRFRDEVIVMLPAGRHTLTISQEEPWHWGVSAASFYCSTGITVLAGGAVGLLTLLYGSVRRRRRRDADDDGCE
jgi:uncharacterized protein YdaL